LQPKQVNYIQEILNETIDLRRKKNDEIVKILTEKNYKLMNDTYNYLIKMPMDSVNDENIEKLNIDFKNKSNSLEIMKNTNIEEIWINELDLLIQEYNLYKTERTNILNTLNTKTSQTKKKITTKSKK
jgi:hypothetical protein